MDRAARALIGTSFRMAFCWGRDDWYHGELIFEEGVLAGKLRRGDRSMLLRGAVHDWRVTGVERDNGRGSFLSDLLTGREPPDELVFRLPDKGGPPVWLVLRFREDQVEHAEVVSQGRVPAKVRIEADDLLRTLTAAVRRERSRA